MENLVGHWVESAAWWWAIGLFLLFAMLESVRPARSGAASTIARWAENFALYAASLGVLYWIAPSDLAGRFVTVSPGGSLFGVLHRIGGDALVLGFGILATDLLVYLVHVMEHRFFLLWRLHAVHHSDLHIDVTTGLRHHPGEILLNALIANLVLISLGQPLWVAAVYGSVSIAASLFNHSNIVIPDRLDRALRAVVVTPGLHRLHHSEDATHYNANFGNIFSFWDRLFGTYRRLPAEQEAAITFGIDSTGAIGFRPLREWVLPFTLRRVPLSPRNAGREAG